MPIRNMGTLLENVVVVEAMRLIARNGHRPLDFVNAFAMPPLSGWCVHRTDYGFSSAQLNALRVRPQPSPSDTYQAMLWSCLQQPVGEPGTVGPNGALLCSMLAYQLGRPMRLWLNDIPDGHYGNAVPGLAAIAATVQRVLGLDAPPENPVVVSDEVWPDCLTKLDETLAASANDTSGRLGYLDPMRYRREAGGAGETDSVSHREWLHVLAAETECPVVSVHFTGHSDWPTLRPEIEAMHLDGRANGFNHTVVVAHSYYHVVCNIRNPAGQEAEAKLAHDLEDAVDSAWRSWFRAIHRTPDALEIKVLSNHAV